MAPAQFQPSTLFTRDLAAYSDAELTEYLEANGGIIDVEDYENLKKDEVLLQRLRLQARARGTAQSRPLDLDNLTARLEVISADRQARPPPPSQTGSDYRSRDTTASLDEEEDYRRNLKRETTHYNTLISEGGRPSHPVSLGRNVLDDPGEYREILSYWQRVNGDGENRKWMVFRSQMCEWRDFRRWQRNNREEGRFLKYVEGVKQGLAEHGFIRPFQLDNDPEQQDKLTTWIEFLDYEYWWYDKDMRFVKRHQPQYDEAWKELVESQVLRPSETDEFICNIDSAFERASDRERAEKSVEAARSAMTLTEKAITDSRLSDLPQREPHQRLVAAQSRLDAAVKSLELIKRRNDLIYEFLKKTKLSQYTDDGREKKTYVGAKDNAERRSILLRWILQQIPLIELELERAAKNDSDTANGRSCDHVELGEEQRSEKQERKRSRDENTVDDELPSKRPRYHGQGSSSSIRKTLNTTDAIPTERSQKSGMTASRFARGRKLASGKPGLTSGERRGMKIKPSTINPLLSKNNSQDVPLGPEISNRRSVRIAERGKRLRASVVAASDTVRIPRRKTARPVQAPTPPSSTESHERESRPRATTTSKRGHPSRDDRRRTSRPQGISKRRGRTRPRPSSG